MPRGTSLPSTLFSWSMFIFSIWRNKLSPNTHCVTFFYGMFLHKEDKAFFIICMGFHRWEILRCSHMEVHKKYISFKPNVHFLMIGVEKYSIKKHWFPIWIKQLWNFLLPLYSIYPNPVWQCHYFRSWHSIHFTIEGRC